MPRPMTSRQRVMAALAHDEPDRTPIFEYVLLSPVADHILGRRYAYGENWHEVVQDMGWEAALSRQARDIVDLARILGHDMLYVIPNAPPSRASKVPQLPAPSFNDPVAEMTWRLDMAEAAATPLADAPYLIYDLVRQEMERHDLDLPILAPAYAHGVWADTTLMQVMALAPEVAHRHFALATTRALMSVEKYLARGIILIGVGGDFAGNRGPLISPAAYRTFIMEEVRKISRRVHAGGGFAVNASDGNLWPVIDDFLLGCEVDGYLEIESRAGMELAELKRRFGSSITFFGNMDCSTVLATGTPAEIRQVVRECLEDGWGNGGHIFCCNNAITASVPVRNYLAIGEGYREFFAIDNSAAEASR